ncbi:MAG: sigma-70 family RNA polymerase sigma factor [Clostridia bacterium]
MKNVEMVELMAKVKAGDMLARDQFVVANLRLVLSVVQRFGGKQEKADDMFQVGCVGLMKAIDNFDTTLGVRFSTYAVPMIIGEIRRYLRDGNSLRVSRSLRDFAFRVLQYNEIAIKKSGTEPSVEELSKLIDVPVSDIVFSLSAISDTISLSQPRFLDDSESSVGSQVEDQKQSQESFFEQIALKKAITGLAPREKAILGMRYFIGKTQIEVSEEIGISQAQVSRLEKNALKQLRQEF